jgi:hypothetical protein
MWISATPTGISEPTASASVQRDDERERGAGRQKGNRRIETPLGVRRQGECHIRPRFEHKPGPGSAQPRRTQAGIASAASTTATFPSWRATCGSRSSSSRRGAPARRTLPALPKAGRGEKESPRRSRRLGVRSSCSATDTCIRVRATPRRHRSTRSWQRGGK